MNLAGSGNSKQEDALNALVAGVAGAARTTCIQCIVEASWAYHALILVPRLTADEKEYLIMRIIDGTFATSWSNRALAWHEEYKKTNGGSDFFTPMQIETLRSAFTMMRKHLV